MSDATVLSPAEKADRRNRTRWRNRARFYAKVDAPPVGTLAPLPLLPCRANPGALAPFGAPTLEGLSGWHTPRAEGAPFGPHHTETNFFDWQKTGLSDFILPQPRGFARFEWAEGGDNDDGGISLFELDELEASGPGEKRAVAVGKWYSAATRAAQRSARAKIAITMRALGASPTDASWEEDALARAIVRDNAVPERLAEDGEPVELRGWAKRARAVMGCERGGYAKDSVSNGLLRSSSTGAPVPRPMHCNHRLCPTCARRRSKSVRVVLAPELVRLKDEAANVGGRVSMLTLTIPDEPGPIAQQADRFSAALAKLTKRPIWRRHVSYAVCGIEMTRSTQQVRRERYDEHRASCAACVGGAPCAEGESLAFLAERLASWWHVHGHMLIGVKRCDDGDCLDCAFFGRLDPEKANTRPRALAVIRRRLAIETDPDARERLRHRRDELRAEMTRERLESHRETLWELAALKAKAKAGASDAISRFRAIRAERDTGAAWLDHESLRSAWREAVAHVAHEETCETCRERAATRKKVDELDEAGDFIEAAKLRKTLPRGRAAVCSAWLDEKAAGITSKAGLRLEAPGGGKDGGLAEVLKYITKPIELGETLSQEELADLVGWMHGRRLLRRYGALHGLKVDEEDFEAVDEAEDEDALFFTPSGELVGRDRLKWCTSSATYDEARAVYVAQAKTGDDFVRVRFERPPDDMPDPIPIGDLEPVEWSTGFLFA